MRDDGTIHALLDARDPAQFDTFMNVVGRALHHVLPSLERRVKALGNNFDAEEVLSRGIERALELLRAQYLGQPTEFKYSRKYSLTFEDWLMTIIGRPGAGARSGIVGDEIKKAKRDGARNVDIDDHVDTLSTPGAFDANAGLSAKEIDCEAFLEALPARERFVLQSEFGLHRFRNLDASAIVRMASEAGFSALEVGKIRRRAGALELGHSDVLRQVQIAQLLDVGVRQVHRIKHDALESLRSSMAANS